MEVCSEVCLEEDRTSATSILSTLAIDSATFNVKILVHDSEKNSGKPIPTCGHCKKQWHTKEQYWKLHGRSLRVKKRSCTNKQNTRRAYVSETTSLTTLELLSSQVYLSPLVSLVLMVEIPGFWTMES